MVWTGLDVGGAHLKVAQLDPAGRVVAAAVQRPCALWQGLDRLERALAEALAGLAPVTDAAVTMTGELVDLFPDRSEGVRTLLACLAQHLPAAVRLLVWTGEGGLLDPAAAARQPLAVASANWLATATLAARRLEEGLLLDIGSTTADLVPFAGGLVRARGRSDRERLVRQELVYAGIARTPVMALAREVPFAGERVPLMAELFAATADIWRVLGLLPEEADQHPAADGGPKTVEASMRRLARMIGADLDEAPPAAWTGLARSLAEAQEDRLSCAARRQLSQGSVSEAAPLVATGSGAFLVHRLARRLERPCRDLGALIEAVTPQARAGLDRCAPAVAVALLAAAEAS